MVSYCLMTKESRRKPPKKIHPKQPKLDDDLTELAAMLDEYRLDNNANGWFKLPWRDGWNAVNLALSARDWIHISAQPIVDFLSEQIVSRTPTAEGYWQASEFLQGFGPRIESYLYAALRCLQVLIGNSSGGGEVYNVLLRRAFRDRIVDDKIEGLVLEHRCRDAIGVSAKLCGDSFDRQRRAFTIAWKRGLFSAAYSIAPIFNVGKLTIHKDART